MAWGKSGIPSNEHTCTPVTHHEYNPKTGQVTGAYRVCSTCGRRM